MPTFMEDVSLTRVKSASAAGQTEVDSDSVDMADYDGVLFFTTVGTLTSGAVTALKIQQSDDNDDGDAWTDLAGTAIDIADDDDGQTFGVQIINPRERYLRAVVTRGTANAVIGEIYALRFGGDRRPIVNSVADAATFTSHQSPAEGTA